MILKLKSTSVDIGTTPGTVDNASVVSVILKDDIELESLSRFVFTIPEDIEPEFSTMVYIVPLQLFSYYMALRKGYDPDMPRNLAKSVTVL